MSPQNDLVEILKGFNDSLDRDLNSIFYNNVFLNTKLKDDHQTLKHIILSRMHNLCTMQLAKRKHMNPDFKTRIPLVWSDYHSVCINWFYEWKNIIKESKTKSKTFKDVTVEFRVLKSKLARLLKTFHRLYYGILEYITCHFDTSLVIPTKLISDLNLEGLLEKMPHLTQIRKLLTPRGKATSHVVLSFYHCLLSLGKIRYHQLILEDSSFVRSHRHTGKMNSTARSLHLKKAERYWLMAARLVPSKSDTYKQLSKLSVEENNYSREIYFSIRRHFTRVNDNKQDSQAEIVSFFKERKWVQMESSLTATSLERNNILHELFEIIRYHILIEINEVKVKYISPEEAEHIRTLKCHVSENLQMPHILVNGAFTNDHIVILVGIFSMTQQSHAFEGIASTPLYQSTNSNQSLLEFILDVVFQIISTANKQLKEGNNFNAVDMISYLAIMRVTNCWIKSDNTVLNYAHRYRPICEIMCDFISTINEIESLCWISHVNKKPKRSYLFEEDVMLKEFTCIECRLTDFDDTEIFDMDHVADRLIGHTPKTSILTKEEEFYLRLRAVVTSMKGFLRHNKCGIKVELTKNKTTKYSDISDNLDITMLPTASSPVMPVSNNRHKIMKSVDNNHAKYLPYNKARKSPSLELLLETKPDVITSMLPDTSKPCNSYRTDFSSL